MQQRLARAERYRRAANRYADLARGTAEPDFLSKLYRQTAVRYALMAEELERWPEPRRAETANWADDGYGASLRIRAEAFLA
jgi:hypothetical protein